MSPCVYKLRCFTALLSNSPISIYHATQLLESLPLHAVAGALSSSGPTYIAPPAETTQPSSAGANPNTNTSTVNGASSGTDGFGRGPRGVNSDHSDGSALDGSSIFSSDMSDSDTDTDTDGGDGGGGGGDNSEGEYTAGRVNRESRDSWGRLQPPRLRPPRPPLGGLHASASEASPSVATRIDGRSGLRRWTSGINNRRR